MTPLKVFIGWDAKEIAAYHVLSHSILEHMTVPVSIAPLTQHVLRSSRVYTRERGPTESTEFSITRFLVPALCDFDGYALFMDCDMLVQSDLTELWMYAAADPGKAVYVCQHDYVPKTTTKFLGQPQTAYPRKNWSSVMLFDCRRCKRLTPDYVNQASGLELHRFHWLRGGCSQGRQMLTTLSERHDEWRDYAAEIAAGTMTAGDEVLESETRLIGSLPLDWNWLVGEYEDKPDAKNLHWTDGGPWFDATRSAPQADLWFAARDRMLRAA